MTRPLLIVLATFLLPACAAAPVREGADAGAETLPGEEEKSSAGAAGSETVTVDPAKATNGDPAEIATVVRSHQTQVKSCYEKALRWAPDLSGKIAVRFVVTEGRVVFATIAGNTLETKHRPTGLRFGPPGDPDLLPAPEQVAGCLLDEIKTWSFPSWPAPVEVTYPWLFRPSPDAVAAAGAEN